MLECALLGAGRIDERYFDVRRHAESDARRVEHRGMRANVAEVLEPPHASEASRRGDGKLRCKVAQPPPVVALEQGEELPIDAIQSCSSRGHNETNAKPRGFLVSPVS